MITKYQFLFDNRVLVKNKGISFLKEHPYIEMSKKQLDRILNLIFDYLSRYDVYVNVYDPDFSSLIFKDLIFLILNPCYSIDDPKFLDTFKKSNRHVHSKIRNKLMEFYEFLELEKYRYILDIINEPSPLGGRPPIDNVLKLAILFLKVYFNESYNGIIEKIKTDDACQCFLSYSSDLIGGSTLWDFHQKITEKLLTDEIWEYHKILLNNKGYREGKSVVQDATFYVADAGHKNASYPRGEKAKTKRNCDGDFSKKNSKTYYGYKIHSTMDCKTHLIFNKEVTKASLHDSQIELTLDEQVDFKDKGYSKNEFSQINGRMKKASRNHPLNQHEERRNRRISKRRSPGERPYSFAYRINNKHTLVTTKPRAETEITVLTMLYNIEQIIRLEKNKNNGLEEEITLKKLESEDINLEFSNYNLFQNTNIYYEHKQLIYACIDKSPKKYDNMKKIYNDRTPDINRKPEKTITPSKSDYRRRIKRKLSKLRKNKKKKLKILGKKLFSSLKLVSLAEI